MSEARVFPVFGALLGALLGLVTMALLTALGVLAPDRLPLFALLGIGIVLGAAVLTQRITLVKKRLVSAIVVGAVLAGVSLTGIPEVIRGGSVSANCMATGTSSLEPNPVGPANTSAIDGFSMTTTDTVQWTTQSATPVTAATGTISLLVGGFTIPLRNVEFAEAPEVTTWSGQTAVADQLVGIQDATGFLVTGMYHVEADIDTDQGECSGDAYLHVAPESPVSTSLLTLLWAVLGVVVIALLVLTIVVRRSIRESDRTLAMVGTSAIPGETSTTAPVSAPTPAGTARLSEPSQPTVPDTSGDRPSSGEVQSPGDNSTPGDHPTPGEDASSGDPRIGKGNEDEDSPNPDDTERPPSA